MPLLTNNKQFVFSGEKFVPHTSFWKKEMATAVEPFVLKGDVIAASQNGRTEEYFTISDSCRKLLWKYVEQRPMENFTLWLSALSIVLSRYTDKKEILVLSPLLKTKGTNKKWEKCVPVFLSLSDEQNLKQLIIQTGNRLKDFYRYQNFPLDLVVESTTFSVGSISNLWMGYGNLHHEFQDEDFEKSTLAIAIEEAEKAAPVSFSISYDKAIFSKAFITQIGQHLMEVLEQFRQLDQSIIACPMLTAGEEKRLLIDFNHTTEVYPKDKTIIDLFEEQANQFPDRTAVLFEEQVLTYQQLQERSNKLAYYFGKSGYRKGDLIGVCLDRSIDMIVGLLAILKSGAAYVPMDPEYPRERINYLIEDTQMSVILSQEKHVDFLQFQKTIPLILVDKHWPKIERIWNGNRPVLATIKDLAYVIYTSGSTGKPKGVMINHESLCMRLSGMVSLMDLDATLVTGMLTNYVFDVSLLEFALPLIVGGSVFVPSKANLFDLKTILNLLAEKGVNKIQVTPSYLTNLIASVEEEHQKTLQLKRICSGGESLKKDLVLQIQKKLPKVKLNNHYGPTETTIDAIALNDFRTYENNIIGKPLPNTSVYIVDSKMDMVPIGVIGEVLIGGKGLAQGYLNRPELTAEKFIKNPFKKGNNSKLYQTGDLARWLQDGNIEFVGRKDEQVKIRGFRVELGEIENALIAAPEVKACSILAKPDERGGLRLIAYVVPLNHFDKAALQTFLSNQLPDYMVPSFWVSLNELPLNVSGKVDKKALPEPDEQTNTAKEYVPLETTQEIDLADIWKELLSVKQISRFDNFFELGGHSLLVMTLISKVYDHFQIKVSLPHVFENPELTALAKIIAQQAPQKYQAIPLAKPSLGDDLYPLSEEQKQIWVVEQQQEEALGFILSDFYHLNGPLHIEHFKTAFRQVIQRHESLRTLIKVRNNQPYQFIQNYTENEEWVEYFDVKSIKDQTAFLYEKAQEELQTGFDLENGPLLRIKIYQTAADKHVMLMTIHHIITDLKSTLIVFNELIKGYNVLLQGNIRTLEPLKIQYKDYATWQLNQQVNPEHKAYWLKQFAGHSPTVLMTPDFNRPEQKTVAADTFHFQIDSKKTQALTQFCNRKGLSLYMVFYSILNFLLHRYSDQEDIVIGSAVSERAHMDLENQVGLYVNILAFRTIVNGDQNFGAFLDQVKQNILNGYKHQSFSFNELVKALRIVPTLHQNPLFGIYLSVGVDTMSKLGLEEFADLSIEPFEVNESKSIHDLAVNFTQKENHIDASLMYLKALYRPERIERMAGHILKMVDLICNEEQQLLTTPLSALNYFPAEEQKQLVFDFNHKTAIYPKNKNVIDLFEMQVVARPNQLALVFEKEEWTYRELNAMSNQLANHLMANGVGKESVVALCLPRSAEMIISIWAILKAGAAYMPIDPEYPEERKNFMLADCGYKVLLDVDFYQNFKTNSEQYPIENPSRSINGANLYSIIYTSGSSGKPKGVQLEHEGLVSHIHNVRTYYKVDETSRFLQFFNIGFDAAAQEVFTSLCFGACLYVRNDEDLDVSQMKDFLNRHQITHADFSSAYFENLIMNLYPAPLKRKLVTCGIGGEKVNQTFVSRYKDYLGTLTDRFFNVYGPTETTLTVTVFDMLEDRAFEQRISIPIGKPYPNRSILLLDNHGNLMPIGAYGEVHIGGQGLARGYFNRPELTKEKFVSNSFNPKEPRLYKTGDLARWLPDGNLEFLGRRDDQVKIRGFRIELGEVESVLLKSILVEQCVVLAQEDAYGKQRLVAYVVVETGYDKTALQQYLNAQLPYYMVPSLIVELPALPLTANGKIDKKALPNPDASDLIGNEFVAARNDLEELLCGVWKALLGVDRVGVFDNFYELGGDSIKALQVASKMHRLGFNLEVKDIFQYQHIDAIAAHLKQITRIADQTPVTGAIAFNAIQTTFFDLRLNNPNHFNQAILLHCPSTIAATQLKAIFTKLMAFHDMLRASFIEEEGQIKQIIAPLTAPVPLRFVDLSEASDPNFAIEQLAEETHQSIDLEKQIWSAVHIQLAGSSRLLIVMHHLIVDGVSWRILLEDLSTLYYQNEAGNPLDLYLKTDSFKVWSAEMLQYAQSETLLVEKAYWRTVTKTNVLPIEREMSFPYNYGKDEKTESFSLSESHTEQLLSQANKRFSTEMNDLLLTAMSLAFHRTFGVVKQVINLEGHGRENVLGELDVKRTIGWFTSLYPTLIGYDSGQDIGANIQQTKDNLRAIPQKGLGYGILKYLTPKHLKQDIDFRYQPQISFNYLGQFDTDFNDYAFKIAPEKTGQESSPLNERAYDFEIGGMIRNRKLRMGITYNTMHFTQNTIKKLASAYAKALVECIDFCLDGTVPTDSSASFTTKNIPQDNLQKLKELFG